MSAPDEPRHDEPPESGLSAPTSPGNTASRPTTALPAQRGGRPGRSPGSRRRAPLPVVSAVNVTWAALLGFLPLLVLVTAVTMIGTPRPSLLPVIRYGLAAWLLSHGVPLRVDHEPLTVIPVLVSAFIWWRLVLAGRNAVRAVHGRGSRDWRLVVTIAGAAGVAYGGLGVLAACVMPGPGLAIPSLGGLPGPARAGLTLALIAGGASAIGAGSASGTARALWDRVPAVARDGIRGAVIAVYLLAAAGALAAGIAIAVNGATADRVLESYRAGVAGQAGLIALCLMYAPNVAVWSSAYLAGPGFTLTVVPALPIFAGLPDRPVTGLGQVLLGVPAAAGVLAGAALVRKAAVARRVLGDWHRTVPMAAVSGLAAAAALAGLSFLAAGALGNDLWIGQVGWQYPVFCGLGIGGGALIGLNAARLVGIRRRL